LFLSELIIEIILVLNFRLKGRKILLSKNCLQVLTFLNEKSILTNVANPIEKYQMIITFATLHITRAPYVFFILPFRYLSSGRYKNEKF
jgi:hypothetical protein